MTDYFEKVRKLDRLINDPRTPANERIAAEAARQRVVDAYESARRGGAAPNASRAAGPSAAPSGNTPRPSTTPSIPRGGVAGIGFNPFQAIYGVMNVPANLRNGWEEGVGSVNSPYLQWYRPVAGAVGAVNEAAGAFIWQNALADQAAGLAADAGFAVNDALRDLAMDLLGIGGESEELSRDTPNSDYEGAGVLIFEGGQMEGVAYNVSYQWRNIAGPGEENNPFESANFNMLGPIQTIKISGFYHNQNAYGQQYPYYQWQFIGGDGSFVLRDATELTNIVVTRLDGQPDTGGNYFAPEGIVSPSPTTLRTPNPTEFAEPPTNTFNPFDFISRAPDLAESQQPDEVLSDEANEGRPEKPWSPVDGLPLVIPFVGRDERTANNQGDVPKEQSKTERCNPACAAPGIIQTMKAKQDILSAIKNLAGNTPELIGLGGLAAALTTLLNKVNSLSSAVGVDAFPIDVPASINQCDVRPGKQLNNLAESQLWQTEQLDAVMGQWCNVIDIETPDGNKQFEVKDMSDAVSEILGMLAAQSINSGITQNAVIRNLIETGATKQQSFLAHQYAKGNAEFLGYEGQRQKTDMPLTFTPGKDLLQGLLGQGNIPVQGWKKTDSRDLGDVLNELLQAAAIIRAVYWRRLDSKNDMQGQVKDIITRQASFPETDRAREDERAAKEPDKDDWRIFLDAVETAFGTGQVGSDGPNNPYGKDFTQRPRIINKQPPQGLE